MLVDIDLLPKKKSRNITTPLVYGICTVFLSFVIISLAVYSHLANEDVRKTEQDLLTVQQLREAKEEDLRRPHNSSSAQRLESAVVWAEEYPVDMVPVMQGLVSFLPSRGFLQSFTYMDKGILNVTVQFDESRDAAYYLYHLNESPLFQNVNLLSISTSQIDEEEEIGTSSGSVLPRYIAKYELSFDRNALHIEEEASLETDEDSSTDLEEEGGEEL